MGNDFHKIFLRLKKEGVFVNPETLRRHHVQGFLSNVYVVDSNKGKLVLHINKIHPEQRRQNAWEKVWAVGKLLDNYPRIPSAHVFLSGTLGREKYFIVQEFLAGKIAGQRVIRGKVFVDEWSERSKKSEMSIERTIARINTIPMQGGGWLVKRGGSITGKYRSWNEFLEREVPMWLRRIRVVEGNAKLSSGISQYFEANKSKMKIKKSVLLHADIMNPGNILLHHGRVSGFVDWEWALAGDPAWEFAFNSSYPLSTYFKSFPRVFTHDEKKDFRRRITLYGPLILTWYLYVWSLADRKAYNECKYHLAMLGF